MREGLASRSFVALAAVLLINGCSPAKSGITNDVTAEQNLKRDCANPTWREQNLGLWYSLCREPLRW